MTDPQQMNRPTPWGNRIIVVLFGAVLAPLGASLLYTFPPTEYSFLPCLFNKFTGLHCPGCGATRCCHSLLHGEWAQAFAWNPLFVILLPFLLYSLARSAYTMWTGNPAPGFRTPLRLAIVVLWVMIGYWVARNIPVAPFTLLAPHELSAANDDEPNSE